jgi:hypothetical protein
MDYLDDETGGIFCDISYALCENGRSRAPMRQFAGGVAIAFLKGVLNNDYTDLVDAIANTTEAPLTMNSPQITGVLPDSPKAFESLLQQKV